MFSFRHARQCRKAGEAGPIITVLFVLIVIGLVVTLMLVRSSSSPDQRDPVSTQGGSPVTTEPIANQATTGDRPGKTTPRAEGPSNAETPKETPDRQAAKAKSTGQANNARALAKKGDYVAAVKAFEDAVALLKPDRNEALMSELADARAERDSRTLLVEAKEAEDRGDLKVALERAEASNAIKSKTETVEMISRLRATSMRDEARKKEANGLLKEAVELYRKADALQPDLGLSSHVKELEDGIKAAEAAAAKARYDGLVARAKAEEAEEDFFSAANLYEEARPFASNKQEIEALLAAATKQRDEFQTLFKMWLGRGHDHMRAGQWGEAIAAFERAFKYNKNDTEIQGLIKQAREKAILQDMVLVPAGEFLAGAEKKPMTLPAFYIDRYEVTNVQYKNFVAVTGHEPPRGWDRGAPPEGTENLPVTGVSWEDAVAYAAWAGKRLPTAEEWEKAARGTDGRDFPWGNEFDPAKCNAAESGARKLVPVGTTQGDVSPFGVNDLAGNAAEWTATTVEPKSSPEGAPGAKLAVLKGASFLLPGTAAGQCPARFADERDLRMLGYGFRCARNAE